MRQLALRVIFLGTGLAYLVLAIGFSARLPAATGLWLWTDTRLSHLFVGSVLAALAAGALWIAWSRHIRAAVPSLVGLSVAFVATGMYLFFLERTGTEPHVLPHALGYMLAAVLAWVMLAAMRGEPPDDKPITPLVRWSCRLYAVTLAAAGAALVARFPNVFPWPLSPGSSTVFGFTFLGLAVVYALTARRGGAGAATVAMSGFLAYDIVLLPPFLVHFSAVAPEKLPSLSVYTAVLVYSAVVAAHHLLTEPSVRSRVA